MRAGDGPIAAWAAGGLGAAALVLLLVVTVRADIGLNVWHPDTPVEPLIYTQSTPEIPVLAREIRARIADGRAKFVFLDDTPDADACGADSCGTTWPWAWYLRHEGIVYAVAGQIERGEIDSRAIVIRPRGAKPAPAALESRSGDIVAYRHRWWFPEEGYRSITLGGLVGGVAIGRGVGLPQAPGSAGEIGRGERRRAARRQEQDGSDRHHHGGEQLDQP
ncbi:MAG: hypothetical protein WCQ48_06445 [Chloroflexota bacterium]